MLTENRITERPDEVKRYRFKGAAGEYVYAGDFDAATRCFLDAAERCLSAERREQALQLRLNAADQRIDELTQPTGEIVWCACGDGHAANSYGAGFLAANNGVCENCEAAGGGFQEPVLIQAVAVTREGDDGMYLEWLLEGGICELDLPGTMLFALPEANDLCDEDGSAEIYTSQPAPVSVVLPERFNNALPFDGSERGYDVGWNGCLDEFARLNTPH